MRSQFFTQKLTLTLGALALSVGLSCGTTKENVEQTSQTQELETPDPSGLQEASSDDPLSQHTTESGAVVNKDADGSALGAMSDEATEGLAAEANTLLAGEDIFKAKCIVCHTLDGKATIGPSIIDLACSERESADGTKVVADDAFLLESLLEPNKQVAKGFPPAMPSVKGVLSDDELQSTVKFIKSKSKMCSKVRQEK